MVDPTHPAFPKPAAAPGMDVRTFLSAVAMHSLLASPEYLKQAALASESVAPVVVELTAELAVLTADALIARLNQGQTTQ
jgi:hypothetical protein